jgi:hypothetical protein
MAETVDPCGAPHVIAGSATLSAIRVDLTRSGRRLTIEC